MAKNLKVCHNGMGWPVGAVIPQEAFGDPGRHIELGALQWTTEEPTIEAFAIVDVSELGDDKLAAENARLQKLLGDLPKRLEVLDTENEKLVEANRVLAKQLADAIAEKDLAIESANIQAHERKQRELETK